LQADGFGYEASGRCRPAFAHRLQRVSNIGARLSVCRKGHARWNQQGKYLIFHRALYELRGPLDDSKVLEVAKLVGLDLDRLQMDMGGTEISGRLRKNIALAQTLGITGTPGFAIGDKIYSGATDLKSLQVMIEEAKRR
jgi:protein-disulfide isomerase